ncbi:MAG: UvrD-helicase domain-containing protein [Clostridia bacterium]|nr:UvrD-helicase domain-containing protein [Clostridia bacterium]
MAFGCLEKERAMELSDLNPMQRLAAETLEGPVLILAGAGSGKTRTITYRIANLIDHGVRPWHILALTFTNKAAKEMQERVERLVGDTADMWMGTFHSICARILRRDIEKIGRARDFVIYDEEDAGRILKDILKDLNIGDKVFTPRELKRYISDAKNKLLAPDEWFAQSERTYRAQQIHDIYTLYDKRLAAVNALDFDDLLIKTLQLFVDNPPVLDYYQRRFEYVHVDEYQDTNRAQYQLVRLLTLTHHNLCVVGDDDQSIYAWRGADIRNILDFEKDYPEARVIKLEQNYRNTSNILEAANQVIAHNLGRKEKRLWTVTPVGEPIHVYGAMDEKDEAVWIADRIRDLTGEDVPLSEICVLYRMHAQSRVMEDALNRAGVPYRIFGGTRFYDRKEIKDALAYLRLMLNQRDDVSLERIINTPRRAIGDTTVNALKAAARDRGISLYEALFDHDPLPGRANSAVKAFADMMDGLRRERDTLPLRQFAEKVIDKSGLIAQYALDTTEEGRAHKENLLELLSAVRDFTTQHPDAGLAEFMENVALVSDLDQSTNPNRYVTLMTLHSVKGLEFDAVFIAGLEEEIFPLIRPFEEGNDRVEEERRLCYVGITRARKKLFLSYARSRLLFNQVVSHDVSRFIREISPDLMKVESRARSARPMPPARPRSAPSYPRAPVSRPKGAGGLLNIPGVTKGFVPSKAREGAGRALRGMYGPGDRVMHRSFGEGKVVAVTGDDSAPVITISFPSYGIKRFSLTAAPIIKLED